LVFFGILAAVGRRFYEVSKFLELSGIFGPLLGENGENAQKNAIMALNS
jgi:hypothetical protein